MDVPEINVNLDSSVRQLDYGFSYRKDINSNVSLSIRHTVMNNLNHIESEKSYSSFFGVKNDNSMLGIVAHIGKNSNSQEIYYSYNY